MRMESRMRYRLLLTFCVMHGKLILIFLMIFSDKEEIAAVHEKLISGYPDNLFKPQANTTRAEAVTVIAKMMKS
jgi:hypothetical protein